MYHFNSSPRSGLQKDVSNGPAILVSHTGEEVDVHAIKPTKAQAIFDRMDIDGVIHENEDPISSGSLSFREVIKIQIYKSRDRLFHMCCNPGEDGEHGQGLRQV